MSGLEIEHFKGGLGEFMDSRFCIAQMAMCGFLRVGMFWKRVESRQDFGGEVK